MNISDSTTMQMHKLVLLNVNMFITVSFSDSTRFK